MADNEPTQESVDNQTGSTSAATTLLSAPMWLAFATAPDDGTEIMAWREDAGVFPVVAVLDEDDPDESVTWFSVAGEDLTGDLPMLWQPYPADPEPVECRKCSEAGGADMPVYHLPPVCGG